MQHYFRRIVSPPLSCVQQCHKGEEETSVPACTHAQIITTLSKSNYVITNSNRRKHGNIRSRSTCLPPRPNPHQRTTKSPKIQQNPQTIRSHASIKIKHHHFPHCSFGRISFNNLTYSRISSRIRVWT